jgi:hypothetical protein
MRVLSGPELSDVFMEGAVDPSGEHIWRVNPVESSASEPAQTQDAPAQDAPAPAVEPSPAPPAEPATSDASNTTSEQPKE